MYVEDERGIQMIAKMSLEKVGGFEVLVADNGNIAIEKIEEFKPDLLILDVMMPILDGPSTAEKLKELGLLKDTPFVFMTAKLEKKEVEELYGLGAKMVFKKPFDPMKFPEQIKELWEKLDKE
ncbi:MAG: CheY-like chemotaxis protein [Bacteriovoracaceae bacterium]|jgi:CheY-like chemotaxis protein